LSAALKAARASRQAAIDSYDRIIILLRGGSYSISEAVVLTPADCGDSANQQLIIAAYQDEIPVLSGGRPITGWKKVDGQPGGQAEVPEVREGKWLSGIIYQWQTAAAGAHRTPGFQIDGDYLSNDPAVQIPTGNISEWVGDTDLKSLRCKSGLIFAAPNPSIHF
jgi:hypothetical protein